MQVKFFPIALLSKTADTELSTPPDKPRTTLSSPSWFFKFSTVVSMNEAADQSFLHPQMFKKLSSKCVPSVE